MSPVLAVRPEGANHQWRKNPPGELSIDPVADERLVWVTAWVGGKDSDFWCAFEDGEVKVIGDEPANTDYDPGPSEKAVS
jgi:hypothetical protein